jgi:hypothetical protein
MFARGFLHTPGAILRVVNPELFKPPNGDLKFTPQGLSDLAKHLSGTRNSHSALCRHIRSSPRSSPAT